MTPGPPDLPGDVAALAAGGKRALARALSALESAPDDPELARLLDAAAAAPRGVAIGLTGPPGVGKSTLCSALVRRLRATGASVGVIAVDPSSRRSGGAILGDRTRIAADPGDAGAFVRSMAARSRLGGLAEITLPATVLMRAVFDWVVIETVGVGQTEAEIADCADLVVLCVQPASGDALQFMKAGIMETPDLVLVTKGDLGAPALRAEADLRGALSLGAGGEPPEVAVVSALTGAGIDAMMALVISRAGGGGGAHGFAARRRAQMRAWTESRLRESFGRMGAAALSARRNPVCPSFSGLASLTESLERAVDEALKKP